MKLKSCFLDVILGRLDKASHSFVVLDQLRLHLQHVSLLLVEQQLPSLLLIYVGLLGIVHEL